MKRSATCATLAQPSRKGCALSDRKHQAQPAQPRPYRECGEGCAPPALSLRRPEGSYASRSPCQSCEQEQDEPSTNRRAGEHGNVQDGRRIDLIEGSTSLISRKTASHPVARVTQSVFAAAYCLTAKTQTRTSDSRRRIAGPSRLNDNSAEMLSASTSRFIGLTAQIVHPSHKLPHKIPTGKTRARGCQAKRPQAKRSTSEMTGNAGMDRQNTRVWVGWGQNLLGTLIIDLLLLHSAALSRIWGGLGLEKLAGL
jgi:hypothetical protein